LTGTPGVVIVGAGQAGFQCAASLREEGFSGAITLIGGEPGLPYQRPPLSKNFLQEALSPESLDFRPARFFAERRIVRLEAMVQAIDRDARCVVFGDGTPALPYDTLVLATGATNRALAVPGAADLGAAGLRTRAEALVLRAALAKAKSLAIIGAGFIGCEVAASAVARGVNVTVIEAAPRALGRAVSAETASALTALLRAAGIIFHFDATVARIAESGHLVGLADGRAVRADLVLVAIGVEPATKLAAAAGLSCADGILTNADFVTTDPSVFAIGDCVRAPLPFAGYSIRLESVQNATDQARHVAAFLQGRDAMYDKVPWFWSDQGRWRLQIAGLAEGCDRFIADGSPERGGLTVYGYNAGKLRVVETINRPADHMAARKLLAAGISPDPGAITEGFSLRDFASFALPSSTRASGTV